jgi:ABC-type nitrate/sulfonate/bicarbonate transport system substrate-binding protein
MVDGLLAGIEATLADPASAFAIAVDVVPEAADPAQAALQRQILDESLRFWRSPTEIGAIDARQWQESATTMASLGLLESPADVATAIDDQFVTRYAAR